MPGGGFEGLETPERPVSRLRGGSRTGPEGVPAAGLQHCCNGSGTAEATGSASDYQVMKLGSVEISQPGVVNFSIKADKVQTGGGVMNLRTITLTPVQ